MVWVLQTSPDLPDQQFELWSKLLEERAGITLRVNQKTFLQTQVSMRMRELGVDDYNSYYDRVVDGVQGVLEWSILIDRLVVKETNFFRHAPSVDFVRNHLQQRIDRQLVSQPYDVWSVGCSTGEEPYSLSMLINESFEFACLPSFYGVTATDISRVALSVAKAGMYSQRKVDFIPKALRHKYFRKQEQDRYQISSELRDKVCFNQANILKVEEMPAVTFDVIFCQNLLVYFRKWLRHQVLDSLAARLKPGGILVIGMGEVVNWSNPQLKRAGDEQVQAYIRLES